MTEIVDTIADEACILVHCFCDEVVPSLIVIGC